MKMKSLILIFIALGCGLVASIGISQVMSQGGKGQKIEMDQILVAKDAIDSGKKFDANMVQFEEWPKQRIPDGAIRKMDEVEGKWSRYRFFKGEPILQAKISDKPGGVDQIIPVGYRVNNIKVDEDTVIEAITPGDTVDVSVFLEGNGRNGVQKTGVYTILKNVRVFAKGGQTERTVDESGREVRARTISLQVGKRSSGDLLRARRRTARSGSSSADRLGSSYRCCMISWRTLVPVNGRDPVSNSWKTMARLYWSLKRLTTPSKVSQAV